MRGSRLCLPVMALLAFAAPCFAQSDGNKFIGTWRLISIEGPDAAGERVAQNPAGYIIYDSTGHMAVQIMVRSDRPRFKTGRRSEGTPEETKAAFVNYTAYYGTYEVKKKEGIVIHHLEGSLFPNEIGKDNIRYYDLSGDRVTLTVPSMVDGKMASKSAFQRRLVWERVR
jgi:hypothetical protein